MVRSMDVVGKYIRDQTFPSQKIERVSSRVLVKSSLHPPRVSIDVVYVEL